MSSGSVWCEATVTTIVGPSRAAIAWPLAMTMPTLRWFQDTDSCPTRRGAAGVR
jgi:hypothetical protein